VDAGTELEIVALPEMRRALEPAPWSDEQWQCS
jgi:hypothetical protein